MRIIQRNREFYIEKLQLSVKCSKPSSFTGVKESINRQYSKSIINFTDREVYISYRNGLTDKISPTFRGNLYDKKGVSDRGAGILIIERHDVLNNNVQFDCFNTLNNPNTDEQKALRDAYSKTYEHNAPRYGIGTNTITIEKWVDLADIEASGGLLYVQDLDLQFSILSLANTPDHPFSDSGVYEHIFHDSDYIGNPNVFAYAIKIVDNENAFTDLYINVNKNVYRIPKHFDIRLTSGIYLSYNDGHARKDQNIVTVMYTFEEYQTHLPYVFTTPEEARMYGDVHAASERILKDKDLELKQLKLKMDQVKLDFEQRERVVKEREKELEHLINMEKMKRSDYYDEKKQERSDYYEEKKAARTNTSEWLKIIPPILTLVISVITLTASLNNPQTKKG